MSQKSCDAPVILMRDDVVFEIDGRDMTAIVIEFVNDWERVSAERRRY